MDFGKSVLGQASSLFDNLFTRKPVLVVQDETLHQEDLSDEAIDDYDREILNEEEPDIEQQKTKPFVFSEAAARFIGRLNTDLSGGIQYYIKKAQGLGQDDASIPNLGPELEAWFLKLKDPSCSHLEIQMKDLVKELLNQKLPVEDLPISPQTTEQPKETQTNPEAEKVDVKEQDPTKPEEPTQTPEQPTVDEKSPPSVVLPPEDPDLALSDTSSSEELGLIPDVVPAFRREPIPSALDPLEASLAKFQKEQGLKVQKQIASMVKLFRTHPFWQNLTVDQEDTLWECIERYILMKISRKSLVAYKVADFRFYELVSSYRMLTPEQLDIKVPIDPELVDTCGKILDNMNFLKTPRSKLICISNCCVLIFRYLEVQYGYAVPPDLFLPVLTYIVIQTNPVSLISNLNFITDYRHERFLLSSWGYLFTNLSIAIDYIEKLTPAFLSPTRLVPAESLQSDWVGVPNQEDEPKPSPSPAATPADLAKEYKYWNYRPSDLKPEDIPILLAEYKRLVMVENTMKRTMPKDFFLVSGDGSII